MNSENIVKKKKAPGSPPRPWELSLVGSSRVVVRRRRSHFENGKKLRPMPNNLVLNLDDLR